MAVGRHDLIIAGKGGHQHQQGGLRQVEIGDHGVHTAETVSRPDKQPGIPTPGPQLTLRGGGLQTADRGGAHRNHTPAPLSCRLHLLAGLFTQFTQFTVHLVIIKIVHPDRLKGSRAHMQGDMGDIHPLVPDPLQHGLIEMEPRGGRRHRTWAFSINGLIAFMIQFLV